MYMWDMFDGPFVTRCPPVPGSIFGVMEGRRENMAYNNEERKKAGNA